MRKLQLLTCTSCILYFGVMAQKIKQVSDVITGYVAAGPFENYLD